MLTLFKLGAYALLGYVFYEFYLGLTQGRKEMRPLRAASRMQNPPQSGQSAPRGPEQGIPVESHSRDGGSARHVVGRGVVSR